MSRLPAVCLSRSILIGNLPFTFTFPSRSWLPLFLRNYRPFIAAGRRRSSAVTVRVKHSLPETPCNDLNVVLNDDGWTVNRPDFSSRSDTSFACTDLSVDKNRYAFDSWLRVHCTLYGLSRHSLLVHGAGCCLDGKTFLFPGKSGQGKSTLIRILGKSCALSDELTLVYRQKKRFRAASTPFWGELKKGDGTLHDGPLQAFCLLDHGATASIRKISRQEALPRLLETVLFFSHEPSVVAQLLALAAALLEKVPAYRLTFATNSTREEIVGLLSALSGRKR